MAPPPPPREDQAELNIHDVKVQKVFRDIGQPGPSRKFTPAPIPPDFPASQMSMPRMRARAFAAPGSGIRVLVFCALAEARACDALHKVLGLRVETEAYSLGAVRATIRLQLGPNRQIQVPCGPQASAHDAVAVPKSHHFNHGSA